MESKPERPTENDAVVTYVSPIPNLSTHPEEVQGQEGENDNDDTSKHLNFWSVVLISIVLCFATLCVAIDNTILATAVPRITREFHSIDDVGWYASIYPLMSCAFQPSFGKIYTLFSSKLVFLCSLLIFEIGSTVCATAVSSHVFILGRSLAGVASAGIQAGTTLILAECVPLRVRPTWNSVIGSMFAVGSVVGPLLGGVFSDSSTWRWCFYVNLPIGGAVILFIIFFYDGSHGGRKEWKSAGGFRKTIVRFDLAGTVTFVSATICLLLALSWGGSTYAWDNARVVVPLTLAGVLFCTFIGVQYWIKDNAIIPLRLLRRRSILAAIWFGICLGGTFFVNVFYIPLWFQIVDGVTAVQSAILFIPYMVSVVGGFMFAGFGTSYTGYYTPFVYLSSILMALGTGLISTVIPHQTSRAKWIGFQILCGAGIGLGEEQGLYMVQATLPGVDVATGISIVLFAQTFGGALFVSVAQTVFLENVSRVLKVLAPYVDPHEVLEGTSSITSPALEQAYGVAVKDALRVGLLLACVSSLGAVMYDWKSLKAQKDNTQEERSSEHELENVTGASNNC